MKMKKIISIICMVALSASLFAGFSYKAKAAGGTTPRNETFYMDGLQWGSPVGWNPLAPTTAFPVANQSGRDLVYETLFMYNQLTGGLEPLLGTKYQWTTNNTLTVTLNKDAKWSDGKPVTAADVAYTYQLGKKYPSVAWAKYWTYLTNVTASGTSTVIFKLNKSLNKLQTLESLQYVYILPQHVWTAIEKKDGNKYSDISKEKNDNPIGSGAYKMYYYDDTKISVVRDDNYWGKAKSAFGKLPNPKYITHNIFKDNASGDVAFKNGEVDMSQQFSAKVWLMWEGGAPIKTYLKDAPYYVAGSIPSLVFNTTKKGLDNASVRKAIAMAIDYKKIADVAMSGYSAPMVPGLNLQTDAEQALVDGNALKSLQWTTDIAAANKLLDSIGAKKGADGIRVLNGTRLGPWDASCPYGWSDWNASLEIVSQSAKAIGIEIRTKFPEYAPWFNDFQTGKFDMAMWSLGGGPSAAQPWARAFNTMYSGGVPAVGQPANWDFGRYKNTAADKIIDQIPQLTSAAKLKTLYTQLNKIFLTDVPTVGLMYRPGLFYTVNESVWTGFPVQGDGSNIPPQICTDGAGIKALYKITAKK